MFKKIKVETIIFTILAVILIAVIAGIAYTIDRQQLILRQTFKKQSGGVVPTPQPRNVRPQPTRFIFFTTPTPKPQVYAPVGYDAQSENLLIQKMQNRKTLSPDDEKAKTEILQLLPQGQKSGILYESPEFTIEYNDVFNIFDVMVKTIDIGGAKEEAVRWFTNHGFSQEAICDYPIEFILDWQIRNDLANSGITFSTLPPNCQ